MKSFTMNKTHTKLILAGLLTASLSSGAYALEHEAEINLGLGRIMFDSDNDMDDATYSSVGVGFVLSDHWTMEMLVSQYDTEFSDTTFDVEGSQYRIDGLYHFGSSNTWRPYAAFGVGDQKIKSDLFASSRETMLNAGVGIKNTFSSRWQWRADARAFNSLDNEYTDVVLSAGISYLLGDRNKTAPRPTPVAAPKPQPAAPLDSDGDGVIDERDQCPNTERRYKVDEVGCPQKLTETVSVRLAVQFDTDSDVVKEEYVEEVRKLAVFMNQYENTEVTVEGHTDDRGSDAYNKNLSQKRASSVRNMLIQRMDIEEDRVKAVGYGEERPVGSNDTVEGREDNRRVVGSVSTRVTTIETKE